MLRPSRRSVLVRAPAATPPTPPTGRIPDHRLPAEQRQVAMPAPIAGRTPHAPPEPARAHLRDVHLELSAGRAGHPGGAGARGGRVRSRVVRRSAPVPAPAS